MGLVPFFFELRLFEGLMALFYWPLFSLLLIDFQDLRIPTFEFEHRASF